MQKPAYDPGLTRQFGARLRRAINPDGSFNVRRSGVSWRAFHPWLHVVDMSWPGFSALVLGTYIGLNTFFAFVYFFLPPDAIQGTQDSSESGRFLSDFFFSGHTLTTVGYGNLIPHGVAANLTATFEALVGLLTFSLITGLLVARVSRPSARISYSANSLVSPYNGGTGLMFRVANERSNNLMELTATVTLMTVVKLASTPERRFEILPLERDGVQLFPLTWTVVHPIDETSPLWGRTAQDLAELQAELIILIKGFDETFGQIVHSRYSYRYDEIVWGAKFLPAFRVEETGDLLLEVDKLGEYTQLS
ncbi:MAG: transporter [Acidobacteriota bacterium]|nr:transporter [Acidobacteriota bacterium]